MLYPDDLDDYELVLLRLERPDVVLNLIWAGSGSLRQAFVVNPLTSHGRENLRASFMIGFGVLSLMPGGAVFAFAYAAALEGTLFLGRLAEHQAESKPVAVYTIDDDALREALVKIGITPPNRPWRPPTEERNETGANA